MILFLVIVFYTITVDANVGDSCVLGEDRGVCTVLTKCPSALQDIKNGKRPLICSFIKSDPVVCCVGPVGSGPPAKGQSHHVCPLMPNSFIATETGQKAFDKCLEYQELVFPCLSGRRMNKCHHGSGSILGNYASKDQFPYAALLGYGNDETRLQWLCGGALISDRFILTAAHCTSSKEFGPVTFAALKTLDAADVTPDHKHKIKRFINHPDFKPKKIYHDIALLELETPLVLDSRSTPACLHSGGVVGEVATSTSWNTNDVLGTGEKALKTITLTQSSMEECRKAYPDRRRGGYNGTTQLCYKDRNNSKHICQDDGGGALVVNSKLRCMYSVIGIVSLGKGCLSHSPGVYTRVEPYVPWIESIVWQ